MPGARIEARELGKRLTLGRGIHPAVLLNLVLKRRAEVADQLLHLAVALRRVMPVHIDLPNRLAEFPVDEIDATLPAIALGLNVVQCFRIEIKAGVIKGRWQELGVVADEARRS